MRIYHSSKTKIRLADAQLLDLIASVSEAELRDVVEKISIPRHVWSESLNNKFVAEWIAQQLDSYGYRTSFQGKYVNVVALPSEQIQEPLMLIGAHYDSVVGSPGADDNASAIAALLQCAKAISAHLPQTPVCFVAFNAEEDGLLGSMDFVNSYLSITKLRLQQVHILEMVGFCSSRPDSQQVPSGLPLKIPTVGDFLGIVGNKDASHLLAEVLANAKTYVREFPVVGLQLYFGIEKYFPDFMRSDHGPFWSKRIPTLMWTDTADFRNPHYHLKTDTPDTLDYSFLRRVTQLLLAQALHRSL